MSGIYKFLPYIEKLETSRILSNYLMDNYGITQLLEVINAGCEERVVIKDYSLQVIGWRVVTTITSSKNILAIHS